MFTERNSKEGLQKKEKTEESILIMIGLNEQW